MSQWLQFFLGTPRRTMWTIAAIMVMIGVVYPPFIHLIIRNFWNAFGELIKSLVALVIVGSVVWGFIRSFINGRR